jgi:hypothetical protein
LNLAVLEAMILANVYDWNMTMVRIDYAIKQTICLNKIRMYEINPTPARAGATMSSASDAVRRAGFFRAQPA